MMWSGISKCLVRLLQFGSPISDQAAQHAPSRYRHEALMTDSRQAVIGTTVEQNGAAMVTPGPKFPALMKRQGSSFIGYISSGSGCKLDDVRLYEKMLNRVGRGCSILCSGNMDSGWRLWRMLHGIL
jgi:hypothetical protein